MKALEASGTLKLSAIHQAQSDTEGNQFLLHDKHMRGGSCKNKSLKNFVVEKKDWSAGGLLLVWHQVGLSYQDGSGIGTSIANPESFFWYDKDLATHASQKIMRGGNTTDMALAVWLYSFLIFGGLALCVTNTSWVLGKGLFHLKEYRGLTGNFWIPPSSCFIIHCSKCQLKVWALAIQYCRSRLYSFKCNSPKPLSCFLLSNAYHFTVRKRNYFTPFVSYFTTFKHM